jgi:chemotaxis response regulator CheB
MDKIRVLVAEDSLTVRGYLVEILSANPEFEVVADVGDGKDAIDLCEKLRPDVVTMDMMMPVMTGLAATEYIMAHHPTPILIVSASINRGELFRTYDALAAGAVDVLEKPKGDEPKGVWERCRRRGQYVPTESRQWELRSCRHRRLNGRPGGYRGASAQSSRRLQIADPVCDAHQ